MKEKITFFLLGAFIATVAYLAGDMMNPLHAIDAVEEIEVLKANRILVNELLVTDSITVSSDEKNVQRFEDGIDLNTIGSLWIGDDEILVGTTEMMTSLTASGTHTIDFDDFVIVYTTRTDRIYHRQECRYGDIPTTLPAAKMMYTPCKICRPPR